MSTEDIQGEGQADLVTVVVERSTFARQLKDIAEAIVLHDHLQQQAIGVELTREEPRGVELVEDKVGVDVHGDRRAWGCPKQGGWPELDTLVHVKKVGPIKVKILAIDLGSSGRPGSPCRAASAVQRGSAGTGRP